MIRLNESVPLFAEDSQISIASPVCLPWSKDNYARFADDGAPALVTGWGRVTNKLSIHRNNQIRNRVGSRILLQVKVPLVSEADCRKSDPAFRSIDGKTQICAGAEKGKFLYIHANIFGF